MKKRITHQMVLLSIALCSCVFSNGLVASAKSAPTGSSPSLDIIKDSQTNTTGTQYIAGSGITISENNEISVSNIIGKNSLSSHSQDTDDTNFIIGNDSRVQGDNSIVLGSGVKKWTTSTSYIHIGNQTNDNVYQDDCNYAISIGNNACSSADSVVVIGRTAYSNGIHSIALGTNAFSSAVNSLALGAGSSAGDNNVVSFGHKRGDSYYADGASSGFIDTYSDDFYRRVINVADGIDDHDVATVGQLQTVSSKVSESQMTIKAINEELVYKANADGSNIGHYASQWANAIGIGRVERGNTNLVTGDTVFVAISEKADKSYVDEEIKKISDTSNRYTKPEIDDSLKNKANSDLSNISDNAKQVIKETMKASLDTKADKDSVYTKEETNAQIESKLKDAKDSFASDLSAKANTDAGNIEKDTWQSVLGDGMNEKGNTGLITGDTLHTALADFKNSESVLVKNTNDAISIGKDSTATKVNIQGKNTDGCVVNRVLTGVLTDNTDLSSATNVGYVNGVASNLQSQMNAMGYQLSEDIKEAGAVASALAGLHPLAYDPDNKLSFSVSTAGYRGKSAGALGAFYHPNGNILFSLAGTIGSNHNAWNMGLSFKLGQGEDNLLSRRTLEQRVQALATQNQEKDIKISQLESDVKDLQTKLDRILQSLSLSPDVKKSIT